MSADHDDNEMYENQVPELAAPFAMAYGPELVDSRLTHGARLLRLWLRFRCAGHTSKNYVSYKVLAQDLDVEEPTIKKWMRELRDIGAVRLQHTTDGGPVYKILSAPHKVYGNNLLVGCRDFLRSDRSEAQVRMLISSQEGEGDKNTPGSQNNPGGVIKTTPGRVIKTPPKVEEAQVEEEVEEPQSAIASQSLSPAGVGDRRSHGSLHEEIISSENSIVDLPITDGDLVDYSADDRRKALALGVVNKRLERPAVLGEDERRAANEKRKAEKELKKKEKAELAKWSGEEIGTDPMANQKRERYTSKTKTGEVSSRGLEELFIDLRKDFFPKASRADWGAREKKHAKDLITTYKPSVVFEVVRALFENWAEYSSKFKKLDPGPIPDIGWLYVYRTRIFDSFSLSGKPAGGAGYWD